MQGWRQAIDLARRFTVSVAHGLCHPPRSMQVILMKSGD